MTSRNLLNLGLLGVVVTLVLIVIFEPGKTPEKQTPKLTTLKKESVSKIHIRREAKKDIQFEKINNIWQMVTPYQLAANEFRVDSILRLVEASSHSRHDISKLDKASFKLDKPEVVVTFDDTVKVMFGGNEPLKHHRYVQVENQLHLISDTAYYHVSGKPTSLVSLQLLPKNSSIKAIQLPDRKLELKDGRWQVENEPKDMASDAVTQLLNEWKLAQALDIFKANEKPGKEKILIYIEGQEQPIEFAIVKRKPDFVLLRKDKGVQYQLTEDSAERLLHFARVEPEEKESITKTPDTTVK